MAEYFVKVARLGKKVHEFFLSNGTTVGQAIQKAGESTNNCEVRLNNQVVSLSTKLRNNDIITIVPKIGGGIFHWLLYKLNK